MNKVEVLAPVGNMECLKAAIAAGCDAVYLGGYQFGARNFAGNFSGAELMEALKYAHKYSVKVYITVNTLIYDSEVDMFMEYIDSLVDMGADALIIQDIGMLDLIHQTYPTLELHASTQMHIHSLNGAIIAKELGCKRVVLARETDIATIKEIKEKTNLELEIFVHGALCVSYSGLCLMSSLIGGRSGNRGTCAGTCRKPYKLVKKDNNSIAVIDSGYLLSMKDLNTINNIKELLDINIDSLKIEGRMKRPSYVYAVVSLYKKAVDMYYQNKKIDITTKDINDLMKIFNRGYTKGFLFNEDNNLVTNSFRPNHMGIQIGEVIKSDDIFCTIKLTDTLRIHDGVRIVGNEDVGTTVNVFDINGHIVKEATRGDIVRLKLPKKVTVGSMVLKTTDQLQLSNIETIINSNLRKVSITGLLEIKLGKPIKLTISDLVNTVIVSSENLVEAALNNPTSDIDCTNKISKLGNTIYEFSDLKLKKDSNVFVPAKILNDLKRVAINLLEEKRTAIKKHKKGIYKRDINELVNESGFSVFINNFKDIEIIKNYSWLNIYGYENIYQVNDFITPRLFRIDSNENSTKNEVLIGGVGHIVNYDNIITDVFLNVTNSYTVATLHSYKVKRVTLSYEMNKIQIKELVDAYYSRYKTYPNLELIVYAKEEMMVSKFSLLKKYNLNNSNIYLNDEYNNYYPVYENYGYMNIYNSKPRILDEIDFYNSLNINVYRIQLIDDEDMKWFKQQRIFDIK